MKPETQKQKIIREIKKVLKQMIKEGLNIHNLDEINIVNINQRLNTESLIKFNIIYLNDTIGCCDYWLQCDYYSKAIGKTIIFDYYVDYDSDGETIDLMAESIYQLDLDIINFEARLSLK